MLKVGLIGCGRIMPAHLHGYKELIERNIDVRIKALCARKIEDAKRFRSQEDGVPPRKPVGPPGDPLAKPTYVISRKMSTWRFMQIIGRCSRSRI